MSKFSTDGNFLATGGSDMLLRVWRLCRTDEETDPAWLLQDKPVREFKGHKKDIIDISWSSKITTLLLSASYDHSVILWNTDMQKPQQIFEHPDIVTSVCFKPESNIFVTGSFDKILRIWSTKHKKVCDWQQAP